MEGLNTTNSAPGDEEAHCVSVKQAGRTTAASDFAQRI